MNLQDTVGLITGASSGIGYATATELSGAGMKLIVAGRRADRLEQLASQLPAEVACIDGDITDEPMPRTLIDTAIERFGRLDFVFNNAGIMATGTVDQITDDQIRQLVRVNTEAAFALAYAAVRHWRRTGSHGYLINTSSILGTKTRDTAGVYAGTKYAIEALTESLRIELGGSGIRVACIEPGVVQTELFRDFDEPPAKRLGLTEPLTGADIARVIRFMLEQPDHVLIPRIMVLPAQQKM